MDYQRYTVQDFLQDDHFLQWVLNPTEESDRYWQRIRGDFPELDETMADAIVIIQQFHEAEATPVSPELVAGLWTRIESETSPEVEHTTTRWYIPAGVSAVLLVVFAVWGVHNELLPFHTGANEWVRQVNSTNKAVWIHLPDSSWVSLMPGSRIEYAISSDAPVREVTLHGQAFFDVKRNPDKPFRIATGGTQTQVLGTSFWIKERTDRKSVEVDVVSGKVAVSKRKKPVLSLKEPATDEIILLPNQRVVYQESVNTMSVSLVEHPVLLHSNIGKEQLQFRDMPLTMITAHLSQLYGIRITLANQKLTSCMFTGDVNGMALYDILNLICRSVSATYTVHETQILIRGKGCQ